MPDTIAITRLPSPRLAECELTFVERQPIDVPLAVAQHDAYCRALGSLGAQVERLPAADEYPDSVFVEDTAIVLDEIAVLCVPGAETRRGEVAAIGEALARHRLLIRLSLPATLEGGDVLRIGRRLFVGRSTRTNPAGIEALRGAIEPHGYTVIEVPVGGSLHLKTACTALDAETILLNPAWIDGAMFGGMRILSTDPAEPWAANTLRIGETTLMNAASPRTAEMVSLAGFAVRLVDISEFGKAEGGLTCLSLLFEK